MSIPRILTAVDLFCGAGGLSEGFRQAGFHVLAGQDFDEAAGATFASTHREAQFIGGRAVINQALASELPLPYKTEAADA